MIDQRPISLILAATVPQLGIGKSGGLPWKLAREMKFFRQATMGGVVIMGRKTWESIPPKFKPLKGRLNVVVTRQQQQHIYNNLQGNNDDVIVANSFEDALIKVATAAPAHEKIFVIGGAQLYNCALKHARTRNVILTEIEANLECDTHFEFPWSRSGTKLDSQGWERQPLEKLREVAGDSVEIPDGDIVEDGLTYRFTLWSRS